jgi:predicted MFS family arabinose efflux permease
MFAINLLIITRISDKLNERSIVASTSNLWIFPCLIALVALPDSASTWTRYAASTVLLSYPYCHAILVGWNARISNTVRTRAVGAALYNMCVQAGNIIGSNIFREDDSPLYRRGNKILLAICAFNVVLFYAVKAYYIWRNKTKERKWQSMSPEE